MAAAGDEFEDFRGYDPLQEQDGGICTCGAELPGVPVMLFGPNNLVVRVCDDCARRLLRRSRVSR